MCEYSQVEYACGHLRFIVRCWCTKYQETQKRCRPNIVAVEYRFHENCSDCKVSSSPKTHTFFKKPRVEKYRVQRTTSSASSISSPKKDKPAES
ncbi:Hypothetical protein R9X50_00318800 [Acrodontium crateriforme]|uniref:Uncharacterized protein n=1 Tax=Acrodontium crateriforme TaxID=150365 RepID=A0AAQ3R993_9PEZI|nr:Hypothetical protein R9X50_00318800 [Acrodontium crateriforme]